MEDLSLFGKICVGIMSLGGAAVAVSLVWLAIIQGADIVDKWFDSHSKYFELND